MNTEYVTQFVNAVKRGDDASAVFLLGNGRVTINSSVISEFQGARLSCPLIFPAIEYAREEVALALLRFGASIESFRCLADGDSRTPAGDAIVNGNISALSLCLRLRGNLSCVFRSGDSSPKAYSGLNTAIFTANVDSLVYLLDEVLTTRPLHISIAAAATLPCLARRGSHAKAIFKVLESRGFNFKSLEEVKFDPDACANACCGFPGLVSAADVLLAGAWKSGDAGFLRYLLKGLGLVSTAAKMASLKDLETGDFFQKITDAISPRRLGDAMAKYECAECQAAGPTKTCAGCKVARYCSTECQRSHWKNGGHKKECARVQRHSREGANRGASGSAWSN